MKSRIFLYTIIVFLSSCGIAKFKKQLKRQEIPTELTSRVWKLSNIYCPLNNTMIKDTMAQRLFNLRRSDSTFCQSFNSKDSSCSFVYRFLPEGKLSIFFKNHNLKGRYLISGQKFEHFYGGWNMKVVWTSDPECKINPGDLSYRLSTRGGPAPFYLNKDTLEITTASAYKFKFVAID